VDATNKGPGSFVELAKSLVADLLAAEQPASV
jgi:hypothetical protein